MVAKRAKLMLKDQDVTAAKAKEVKGGIIAILIGLAAPGGILQHGSGGGEGKVAMNDFHFTKQYDAATPTLH